VGSVIGLALLALGLASRSVRELGDEVPAGASASAEQLLREVGVEAGSEA
jgi:hypothetical protein